MDEQTEELRDLFVETTGEESVTERQEADRGDLSDVTAEDAEERIAELVAEMRERYEFESGLDDDALVRVVMGFYRDESDAEIAEAVDADEETVFLARVDLHLVRDSDRDATFPLADLRELIVDDVPLEERADRLDGDADTEAVEHYSRVVEAELRSTRANDRFTAQFADLLTDADLRESHTGDAHETGLEEAAEDIETNTQL
ncbi:conditioned medium-induced protein 4 [Halolamina salifodinae]|uniref:Conditioned medium-induced protein 4 n=1 Tax=Halolamina salifodinae TaxID=1202767 RepID=A0A8T4H289_9EURY|nr:conditioned medium-induced protein 4 [Halolamina salifodinae]MBP1987934.1 hypothetical protein [Halolamina salifodinae]